MSFGHVLATDYITFHGIKNTDDLMDFYLSHSILLQRQDGVDVGSFKVIIRDAKICVSRAHIPACIFRGPPVPIEKKSKTNWFNFSISTCLK